MNAADALGVPPPEGDSIVVCATHVNKMVKEGRKEGRKCMNEGRREKSREGRTEGRKDGRKEGEKFMKEGSLGRKRTEGKT
jgi:hypothetical protein